MKGKRLVTACRIIIYAVSEPLLICSYKTTIIKNYNYVFCLGNYKIHVFAVQTVIWSDW